MTLRECACKVPEPHTDPRKAHACVRCGFVLGPAWTSSNETVAAFFDSLARTFPSWPHVPPWFENFRLHCEAREFAGRKTFRQTFHARDNAAEGFEEAADGALYALFDSLKTRRAEGDDPDLDLALTAAYHFGLAYKALEDRRHKRRGAP